MDDYGVPVVVVLGIPLGIDDVTQLTAEACQPVNIVRQLHVLYQIQVLNTIFKHKEKIHHRLRT